MAKQTFTTGQVLTAAQMTSLQQTAMLGGAASAKTASYTLEAADAGGAISMSNASATTITVNTALFAAGDTVNITNLGAGVCTITAGTATVNTASSLALAQYESGTLDFTSTSAAVFIKGAGATPAASGGINPNIIINGNFTINQRAYVSAASLGSGSYGFDRWKSNAAGTTLTYTSAPAGQTITINSTGGITQIIERANVIAGTYTLSWSGTATARIYNVGATPPSYAASPVSFSADGLANVQVDFTASGGTKTCSLIKLESGSSASTFVFAGGTIAGELAACQRYFYAITLTTLGVGYMNDTTKARTVLAYPQIMRSDTPTATLSATASTILGATSSGFAASANSAIGINEKNVWIQTTSTGLTAGRGCLLQFDDSTSNSISAEL